MRMQAAGVDGLRWVGHVVDSLVYILSPVLACFLLRVLQVSLPAHWCLLLLKYAASLSCNIGYQDQCLRSGGS